MEEVAYSDRIWQMIICMARRRSLSESFDYRFETPERHHNKSLLPIFESLLKASVINVGLLSLTLYYLRFFLESKTPQLRLVLQNPNIEVLLRYIRTFYPLEFQNLGFKKSLYSKFRMDEVKLIQSSLEVFERSKLFLLQNQYKLLQILHNAKFLDQNIAKEPLPNNLLKNSFYLILHGSSKIASRAAAAKLMARYPTKNIQFSLNPFIEIEDLVGHVQCEAKANGDSLFLWQEGPMTLAARMGQLLVFENFEDAKESVQKFILYTLETRHIETPHATIRFNAYARFIIIAGAGGDFGEGQHPTREVKPNIRLVNVSPNDSSLLGALLAKQAIPEDLFAQLSIALESRKSGERDASYYLIRDIIFDGDDSAMREDFGVGKFSLPQEENGDVSRFDAIFASVPRATRAVYPRAFQFEKAMLAKVHSAFETDQNIFIYGSTRDVRKLLIQNSLQSLQLKSVTLSIFNALHFKKFFKINISKEIALESMLGQLEQCLKKLSIEETNAEILLQLRRLLKSDSLAYLKELNKICTYLLQGIDRLERLNLLGTINRILTTSDFFIKHAEDNIEIDRFSSFEEYLALLLEQQITVIIDCAGPLNRDLTSLLASVLSNLRISGQKSRIICHANHPLFEKKNIFWFRSIAMNEVQSIDSDRFLAEELGKLRPKTALLAGNLLINPSNLPLRIKESLLLRDFVRKGYIFSFCNCLSAIEKFGLSEASSFWFAFKVSLNESIPVDSEVSKFFFSNFKQEQYDSEMFDLAQKLTNNSFKDAPSGQIIELLEFLMKVLLRQISGQIIISRVNQISSFERILKELVSRLLSFGFQLRTDMSKNGSYAKRELQSSGVIEVAYVSRFFLEHLFLNSEMQEQLLSNERSIIFLSFSNLNERLDASLVTFEACESFFDSPVDNQLKQVSLEELPSLELEQLNFFFGEVIPKELLQCPSLRDRTVNYNYLRMISDVDSIIRSCRQEQEKLTVNFIYGLEEFNEKLRLQIFSILENISRTTKTIFVVQLHSFTEEIRRLNLPFLCLQIQSQPESTKNKFEVFVYENSITEKKCISLFRLKEGEGSNLVLIKASQKYSVLDFSLQLDDIPNEIKLDKEINLYCWIDQNVQSHEIFSLIDLVMLSKGRIKLSFISSRVLVGQMGPNVQAYLAPKELLLAEETDASAEQEQINGKLFLISGRETCVYKMNENNEWKEEANFPERLICFESKSAFNNLRLVTLSDQNNEDLSEVKIDFLPFIQKIYLFTYLSSNVLSDLTQSMLESKITIIEEDWKIHNPLKALQDLARGALMKPVYLFNSSDFSIWKGRRISRLIHQLKKKKSVLPASLYLEIKQRIAMRSLTEKDFSLLDINDVSEGIYSETVTCPSKFIDAYTQGRWVVLYDPFDNLRSDVLEPATSAYTNSLPGLNYQIPSKLRRHQNFHLFVIRKGGQNKDNSALEQSKYSPLILREYCRNTVLLSLCLEHEPDLFPFQHSFINFWNNTELLRWKMALINQIGDTLFFSDYLASFKSWKLPNNFETREHLLLECYAFRCGNSPPEQSHEFWDLFFEQKETLQNMISSQPNYPERSSNWEIASDIYFLHCLCKLGIDAKICEIESIPETPISNPQPPRPTDIVTLKLRAVLFTKLFSLHHLPFAIPQDLNCPEELGPNGFGGDILTISDVSIRLLLLKILENKSINCLQLLTSNASFAEIIETVKMSEQISEHHHSIPIINSQCNMGPGIFLIVDYYKSVAMDPSNCIPILNQAEKFILFLYYVKLSPTIIQVALPIIVKILLETLKSISSSISLTNEDVVKYNKCFSQIVESMKFLETGENGYFYDDPPEIGPILRDFQKALLAETHLLILDISSIQNARDDFGLLKDSNAVKQELNKQLKSLNSRMERIPFRSIFEYKASSVFESDKIIVKNQRRFIKRRLTQLQDQNLQGIEVEDKMQCAMHAQQVLRIVNFVVDDYFLAEPNEQVLQKQNLIFEQAKISFECAGEKEATKKRLEFEIDQLFDGVRVALQQTVNKIYDRFS